MLCARCPPKYRLPVKWTVSDRGKAESGKPWREKPLQHHGNHIVGSADVNPRRDGYVTEQGHQAEQKGEGGQHYGVAPDHLPLEELSRLVIRCG